MIVLSGPLFAGKSTLAACLHRHRGTEVITAREILSALGGDPNDRYSLQVRGAELERETQGRWLLDGVLDRLARASASMWVVDSVRTPPQARLFRLHFADVFLLHVTAAEGVRRDRFAASAESGLTDEEGMDRLFAHEVERHADDVRSLADAVIDTTTKSVAEACIEAEMIVTRSSSISDARPKRRNGLVGEGPERHV